MNARVLKLRIAYYSPILFSFIRILLTFIIFIWNPLSMSFRYVQLIPLIFVCISLFSYAKLYHDSTPIFTVLLPTILQFAFVWVLNKRLEFVPFIPVFVVDIMLLTARGIKESYFPFEIEGEDDDSADLERFAEEEF